MLATAIREIAKGAKQLLSSGLNEDAIITLLHRSCRNVSREDIATVLRCLASLERDYTVPKAKQ